MILRDAYGLSADPEELVQRASDANADILSIVDRTWKNGFNRITAAQLAEAQFELEYLIPGVLVKGQPFVFVGPKKGCKTLIALDMALALGFGGHWLGFFQVAVQCRVLFMSGESGMPTIQEGCVRICRAAGRRLEDADVIFSDQVPQIGNPESMAALAAMLKADQIGVLFIDPLYLALNADGREGSIFAVGACCDRSASCASRWA